MKRLSFVMLALPALGALHGCIGTMPMAQTSGTQQQAVSSSTVVPGPASSSSPHAVNAPSQLLRSPSSTAPSPAASPGGQKVSASATDTTKTDKTGLVGRILVPTPLPKNTDMRLQHVGNDYYQCGGALLGNGSSSLAVGILRKGLKSSCTAGNLVLTLERRVASGNREGIEILDAVQVTLAKGQDVSLSDCEGATIAISKYEDKQFYTKHVKAWNVLNNRFAELTDTRKVRCANPGYGA